MKEIDLRNYRPVNSSSYSGRPQGESVRKSLSLSKIEDEVDEIIIKIPSDTTSFNPSFFLGLLYDSITKYGIEKFQSKYHIKIETRNSLLKLALQKNIDDGFRNATNSLNNKSGLNIF